MKWLWMVLCLGGCGMPAWAGLPRMAALDADAAATPGLGRVTAMECTAPVVQALDRMSGIVVRGDRVAEVWPLGAVPAIDGGAPAFAALAKGGGLDAVALGAAAIARGEAVGMGGLPAWPALAGARPLNAGEVPGAVGLRRMAAHTLDPYMTWYEVWSEGAAGELRKAAVEAAKKGDDARYRKIVAQYWQAVAVATERRGVFEEREGAEGQGSRRKPRRGE